MINANALWRRRYVVKGSSFCPRYQSYINSSAKAGFNNENQILTTKMRISFAVYWFVWNRIIWLNAMNHNKFGIRIFAFSVCVTASFSFHSPFSVAVNLNFLNKFRFNSENAFLISHPKSELHCMRSSNGFFE